MWVNQAALRPACDCSITHQCNYDRKRKESYNWGNPSQQEFLYLAFLNLETTEGPFIARQLIKVKKKKKKNL